MPKETDLYQWPNISKACQVLGEKQLTVDINEYLTSNYFVHIFKKSDISENIKGMGEKSDMEITFNVYHKIKEIQDPMSHHTKELKASWGSF